MEDPVTDERVFCGSATESSFRHADDCTANGDSLKSLAFITNKSEDLSMGFDIASLSSAIVLWKLL